MCATLTSSLIGVCSDSVESQYLACRNLWGQVLHEHIQRGNLGPGAPARSSLGRKRRGQILHHHIPGTAHSREWFRDVRNWQRLRHGPHGRSSDSSRIRQVSQEFGDILTLAQQPHDIDVVVALEVAP